ncbi:MAG: AMP-binding protein [Planctomycetes bacterium]|nr:AMP-binding protein [Planctomycetota bacterium]
MPLPSYDHGACDIPLLGGTIGANLRRTVERFGEREALIVRHQNFRATYRELWELVARTAKGLVARGVKTGDRVGVWSPNRFEWVVVQYATARLGAILVNINPAYKATELEYALNKSGVSLLLLAKGFRHADYCAILADVRDRCPDLRESLVIDSQWDELLAAGAGVSDEQLEEIEGALQFDDPINIQYTSGTTGFPKGATLTHHNILNNGYFTAERMRYTERERVCVPVPFYHCFGMVIGNLACTSRGACIVVPSESFDPLAVLETVQAERCTSLYGVPTMFIAELDHPRFAEFDLSSLRTGVVAGAPCPVEVMKRIIERMHLRDITGVCGMTETSPTATQTTTDAPFAKRVETVGRAAPHVEIKIIDPATGRLVLRGTPGEQCTRGYNVMRGYWMDAEATAKAIDADGWMHTGDLAVMDADGYVSIVGRIKDIIIRGGENISPREVEEFLHTIDGVAEAQVIGVPCPKYGEEVMAWVRLKAGATLTADDLRAACVGRIATFKIPRFWKFVDAFPLTVTGKVQKYRMREIAAQELATKQ